MAITKFIPEVWAAELLSVLDTSLVYAGSPCSNRDYEGEISAFGDTVHITSIGDPTITPYTKNTNLSDPEALTDDEQLLVIDQQNSFNFQVDDIDKAQVRNNGGLMSEASRRAGFKLRDAADKVAAGRMRDGAGKDLGFVDASSTATNVYDKVLVPASVALDEADVPEEERWIVLPPAVYGKLQLDDRFIKAAYSGSDALHNGRVGDAAGFRIYKSNNAPTTDRAITSSITVATTAKTLTSATAVFKQSDVGSVVAGTNITTGSKIASVSADGKVATMDTNGATAAAQTDTVLSAGSKLVIAGSSLAHSYAEQINQVEAYRPEKRFADALKGLHVFGTKVVRSEALVISAVKTAA
jgi:hypothetical protein